MLVICGAEFCKFVFCLRILTICHNQIFLLLSLQVYDSSLLLLLEEELLHVPLQPLDIVTDGHLDWLTLLRYRRIRLKQL